jgi:hypothetical protein
MSSFRLYVHPSGGDRPRSPPPGRFERRLRRVSGYQLGFAARDPADLRFLRLAPALAAAFVVGLAVALAVWRLYGLRH